MLRYIIQRELTDHLRSLRLSLTILLVVIVMIVGSILYVHNYRQLVADYSKNVNDNLNTLAEKAKKGLWDMVSFYHQPLYRSPNPLGFIAEGHEKDLPNVFQVDAFEITGPQTQLRGNYTLWQFDQLDWIFIIGVVLSFAALVLTYDSISGERERGTLRLTLSNSISRATLLLGKYIAAFLSLSIPLFVGMLFSLLVISTSGVILLEIQDWCRIGIIMLLSSLYISFFVMMGVFISSLTRYSATSLVILLLVWMVFVVVIPKTGGMLASELVELPDFDVVSKRAWDAAKDVLQRYGKGGFSAHWSPGEPLSRSVDIAHAQISVYDQYRNQQLRQVKLAQNITRISPTSIYQLASKSLIGSGIVHYERFLQQVRQYRESLLNYTQDKYPFDPGEFQYGKNTESIRIDFNEIPKFSDRQVKVFTALTDAVWDILLLFLFNAVFFLGAFLAFIKYDIR